MSSLTDVCFSYSLNVDPGYLITRPIRVLYFTHKQKVKSLHFVVVLNVMTVAEYCLSSSPDVDGQ